MYIFAQNISGPTPTKYDFHKFEKNESCRIFTNIYFTSKYFFKKVAQNDDKKLALPNYID
jgi:hypothetical protein